jgi:hypothetical protein
MYASVSLELEFWMVVSHHVGAGNWTQVLLPTGPSLQPSKDDFQELVFPFYHKHIRVKLRLSGVCSHHAVTLAYFT